MLTIFQSAFSLNAGILILVMPKKSIICRVELNAIGDKCHVAHDMQDRTLYLVWNINKLWMWGTLTTAVTKRKAEKANWST